MSGTALPTDGRFPVRRKRPNRPPVDNALRASWRPRYGDRFIHPLVKIQSAQVVSIRSARTPVGVRPCWAHTKKTPSPGTGRFSLQ